MTAVARPARTVRIGLLWHSRRSGNLGVGALTVSNIALVRGVCAELGIVPSFTVIGPRERGPLYVAGEDIAALDLDTRFLASPRGFARAAGHFDAVLDIGAGDSFATIYGPRRFAFLWLSKAIVLARGVPLLLSPQTIGPFEGRLSRRLAAAVMRRARAIVARDPLSEEVAGALAGPAPVTLAIDVAFALAYDPPEAEARATVRVGLNVSGLLYTRARRGAAGFGLEVDYAQATDDFLAAMAAREDVEVHLFTHALDHAGGEDDDGAVADALARRFPHVRRVPDFASPSDAKSAIAGFDLVIAGRMHACIAAFSSGVAVVPIAYSRKFSGLFEGVLGYPHGVPVRGLSTTAATAYLIDAIARRDTLRADVLRGGRVVAGRLEAYRDVLRRFLRDVA